MTPVVVAALILSAVAVVVAVRSVIRSRRLARQTRESQGRLAVLLFGSRPITPEALSRIVPSPFDEGRP